MQSLSDILHKIEQSGFGALNTLELLTLLVSDSQDPAKVASYLLTRFQNLYEIEQAPLETLTNISGIGKSRALRLKAALALGRIAQSQSVAERPIIKRPSDVVKLIQQHFLNMHQEQLLAILLDTHNRVIDIEILYIGSLNATVVRMAEVLRSAIIRNSAGMILVHNHPSGKAEPSIEDIQFTQDIVIAGQLMDIAILDHVIIGNGEWVSMRERGLGFQSNI
ncbi:MAG: hypothetical protein CUN55_11215 [Phototrophicales bacterium]|nr:MAG: hypothetical protein CUN55_11215 [Phototrophicales bacterium]